MRSRSRMKRVELATAAVMLDAVGGEMLGYGKDGDG